MSSFRRFLQQPANLAGAAFGVGVSVAAVALDQSGRSDAALAVWLTAIVTCGFVVWSAHRQKRNAARRASGSGPIRTHRIQEAAKLRQPPQAVWELIAPPETAPLLSPRIARGYRVPGSPEGLGEQQAFVDLDGHAWTIEILAFEPARRAVATIVSPPTPVPIRLVYNIEPLGDGCILTYGQEYEAAASHVMTDAEADSWRAHAKDYLARVRAALDAAPA